MNRSRSNEPARAVKSRRKIVDATRRSGVKYVQKRGHSDGKTASVKQGMEPGPSGISKKERKDLELSTNKSVKQNRKVKTVKGGKRELPSQVETGKNTHLRKRRKVNYSVTNSDDNSNVDAVELSSEDEYMDSGESDSESQRKSKRKIPQSKGKKNLTKKAAEKSDTKGSVSDSDSDFEGPHCKPSSCLDVHRSKRSHLPQRAKNKKSKTPKEKRSAATKNVNQTHKHSALEFIDNDSDFEVSSKPLACKRVSTHSNGPKSYEIISGDNSDSDGGQRAHSKSTANGKHGIYNNNIIIIIIIIVYNI